MRSVTGFLLFLSSWGLILAAAPKPPRQLSKSPDCKGNIAFSAVTNVASLRINTPIPYKTLLVDDSSGLTDDGIFTVQCDGVYQLSFSGYSSRMLTLSLKRRPSAQTSAWSTLVQTGPNGGSITIAVTLHSNEQVAVFQDIGAPISTPNQSFSGFRIFKL